MYLKKFREKLNLTQNELASILDIAQTTIARYENDKVKPTSTVLLKYVNQLNANPLYLFKGIEPIFLDEQINLNKVHLIEKKKDEIKKIQSEIEIISDELKATR